MEPSTLLESAVQRVSDALQFKQPARIPQCNFFIDYSAEWEAHFGPETSFTDISVWIAVEGAFCTRARKLRKEGGYQFEVDAWGRTLRTRPDAYFLDVLDVPLASGVDLDSVRFDSPSLDERYLMGYPDLAAHDAALAQARARHFLFAKVGGPFHRSTFLRGEAQFLMDLAADPEFASALANKVGDHLIEIGLQALHRYNLYETGVWIGDDMAYNRGPLFSPRIFEKIFLPIYRRMVLAFKQAGASCVILHSDGNIRPFLEMLVDAGIDGINPVERRAGMDPFEIRNTFPRLRLIGGICNTDLLINGPVARIRSETQKMIDLGREGGIVIGTHTISPEVSFENFAAYQDTIRSYGRFE